MCLRNRQAAPGGKSITDPISTLLGITLYELFTGQRPFKSQDALKVIYAHTALQPAPPESVDPQLPAGLSGVILKLLAKSPNERYQTAAGLAADLLHCSNELTATGRISAFEPGAADFGDRLTVPHRLYGREKESAAIEASLARAKRGQGEVLLVAGYSGIGKTGLVRQLSAPVIVEGGYFISGKFDQLVRGTPYTAICEAFSELARQLLMESDQDIQRWREKILEALGASAQVVLDLLPDFEPILGAQPLVPALGPAEAQNRFNRNFRRFLRVFANPDRPLVLFLDDLQWVDSASMDLLQVLLDGSLPGGLLVVGAYRDNEVGDDHVLARAIAQFEASGTPMTQIVLPPLGEAALRDFVVDTLRGDEAHATPLAELVAKKTGGNPFFMTQFMKSLAQEQLLLPDYAAGVWTYDLNGITGQPSTDNVVDLLAGRINRFADSSRAVLKVAACLGNRFDEATLAIAFGESTKRTRAALREGLLEGLVVMGEDDTPSRSYRFLHDRVQQAAYALIPDDECPAMHIAIGRSLLQSMDDDARAERVFELIDQIRRGLPLIQDEDELRLVFALAVKAGRKAKAAAAYAEALDYFHTAEQLLSPDAWSDAYAETFDLMLGIAECEYLSGHFEDALESFDRLESRAASALDSAKVQILRAAQYETRSNYVDAVRAIRAGLAPLGIEFPDREGFDSRTRSRPGRSGRHAGRARNCLLDRSATFG